MSLSQKMHLNIVSGFLGSGKTTAIIRYISEHQLSERILVIINEFGENNIDGHEIELRNLASKFTVWHIPGGCICCVSKMVLNKKLIEAGKSKEFDRIIIEPSGLARASDIIDMVDKSTLKSVFNLHPVICMVHPGMTIDGHAVREPIVWEQIQASDVIVANFSDKITESEKIKFESKIRSLTPSKMSLIHTSKGEFPSSVFNLSYPIYKIHKISQSQENSTTGFSNRSFRWERCDIFDVTKLSNFFNEVVKNNSIIRAKGFFHTDKGWMKIELANGTINRTSSEYRADSRIDLHYQDNDLYKASIEKILSVLNTDELLSGN